MEVKWIRKPSDDPFAELLTYFADGVKVDFGGVEVTLVDDKTIQFRSANPTPTNTSLREEIQQILASYRVRLNTPAFEVVDAAWKAKENNSKIDHATTYATAEIEALLTAKTTEARIDTVERLLIGSLDYDDFVKRATKQLEQLQHPTKETE